MFTNPWYGNASSVAAVQNGESARWEEIPEVKKYLERLQQKLKPGWTVQVNKDGRLYYCK
jgi:hypothetical protein